jgi:DNA-binding beta-propeller fold protein YncE
MRALLPLLAGASLLFAGCSDRERANPFDPLNPSTGGRPSGFAALAGNGEVRLFWDAATGDAFVGFQLFRRDPGETGYHAITGLLPRVSTSYLDAPLANGSDFAYRLHFVFQSGLGTLAAEDIATPGTTMPWMVESGGSEFLRLTPDNRHVSERRGGLLAAADVAANPRNGDVWVADQGGGRLVIYQNGSGVTVTVPGFQLPTAVAVDPSNTTAWVCDASRGLVYHVRRDGQVYPAPIGPLVHPVDSAVDPFSGDVWICEFGGDRVRRYDGAGVFQWSLAVPGPSRVAVDSTTQEAWVTSFEDATVTHVSPGGQVLGTYQNFVAPLGVAVDSPRDLIWIADPYAARVTALHRDGQEAFHVTGLTDAGELSVDAATGEAWVVLGTIGSVLRISPSGTILRSQGGFHSPFAISVDPGGH